MTGGSSGFVPPGGMDRDTFRSDLFTGFWILQKMPISKSKIDIFFYKKVGKYHKKLLHFHHSWNRQKIWFLKLDDSVCAIKVKESTIFLAWINYFGLLSTWLYKKSCRGDIINRFVLSLWVHTKNLYDKLFGSKK